LSLDRSANLVFSRHADLKSRENGDVLVLPERALRIGGSGGEILRICQGGTTAEIIVATMRTRYPETPGIETEVLAFLEEMFELGGIVIGNDVSGKVDGMLP
jgi:pyrroloquinoline quinone biosynthesis protein D